MNPPPNLDAAWISRQTKGSPTKCDSNFMIIQPLCTLVHNKDLQALPRKYDQDNAYHRISRLMLHPGIEQFSRAIFPDKLQSGFFRITSVAKRPLFCSS